MRPERQIRARGHVLQNVRSVRSRESRRTENYMSTEDAKITAKIALEYALRVPCPRCLGDGSVLRQGFTDYKVNGECYLCRGKGVVPHFSDDELCLMVEQLRSIVRRVMATHGRDEIYEHIKE